MPPWFQGRAIHCLLRLVVLRFLFLLQVFHSEEHIENTMLMSFGVKFIRGDQKQRRNGKACRAVIENNMLVSFDVKFIRRDQKQRRNGEACEQ